MSSLPMKKLRVFTLQEKLGSLVDALYQFGAVHVVKSKINGSAANGVAGNSSTGSAVPLSYFKDVSEALVALRAAEKVLGVSEYAEPLALNLKELLDDYKRVDCSGIIALGNQLEQRESEIVANRQRILLLEPFRGVAATPSKLTGGARVAFTHILLRTSPAELESELTTSKVPFTVEYSTPNGRKEVYATVGFDRTRTQDATRILQKHAVKQFDIPSNVASASFASELNKLNAKQVELQGEVKQMQERLNGIAVKNATHLGALRAALEGESRKAQLPFSLGRTEMTAIVEGWVPTKHAGEFEKQLREKLGGVPVVVEELHTGEHELAPTKLVNKRPLNSFEELVKFFSLPKSYEVDPTMLVAISFPLFFGMIVGDIGYGLGAFVIVALIRSKMKGEMAQAISVMLSISAISSIIFGYIFGEFFGFEHILGVVELHPLIHRTNEHGLALLMALTIAFGVMHLAIGYMIGAAQAAKHKHYKHAGAKLSWLLLEFALIFFIVSQVEIEFFSLFFGLAHMIPPLVSGLGVVIALVGIGVFEGPTALFEIPGLISNIFSYLRIMALGVSGVIIALILNKIPPAMSFNSPEAIVLSVFLGIVYVLGHTIGIVLALFESMIQSMRLQYVEFFSKFFEGGGIAFDPINPRTARLLEKN